MRTTYPDVTLSDCGRLPAAHPLRDDIGMLVAFQMFAGRMSQPMLRLASVWQELQPVSIAVPRPAEGKGRVEMRNLSFRYGPDQPWLLRNFDLALVPGRLTVLTGPSGSGKSTLAKLLLRFYQVEHGRILLDGRHLAHLSANELRGNFGLVPQETFLFSGTIYENVLAANPNAGFGDVATACRFAEIHDAIEKLPQGYDTPIGEHGVALSDGQKQRLAIARALLKRPRILIFDEATSGLDQPTAERFAQTVNKLKRNATILFIAGQVPRGLAVDEVATLGVAREVTRMGVEMA